MTHDGPPNEAEIQAGLPGQVRGLLPPMDDPDCTCAHSLTLHPEAGACRGTGATLTDPADYPWIPADEPCLCTRYERSDA